MSVLNKMLRDLEQRQPAPGASANINIAESSERPLWFNSLLVLCVILLGFASYIVLTQPPMNIEAEQQAGTGAEPAQQLQMASDTDTDTDTDAAQSDVTASALPSVSLENTQVQAIAKVLAVVPEAEPKVANVVDVAEAVIAESLSQPFGQKPPLGDPQGSASVTTANMRGKASVQVERGVTTVQQRAAALQQQALAETQAGRLQRALPYWQQLQQLTPNAEAVYLAQARLWGQLGQPAQAEQVLQQGLAQGIVSADIQLLLAQQAAGRAQWQQVDILLPANFELAQQPQYYGLKATALQQLGQQQAALQWFNQLIVLQPQQARWWLGAAIAYDAMAKREQAHLHYRQAQQWGDSLSVASRNYIQQRIAATE